METSNSEIFKSLILDVWRNDIKKEFDNGNIIYERQLQAYLFHFIKMKAEHDFQVWIEPVWYDKPPNGTGRKVFCIPDMVITKGNDIIAVIELKWLPWAHVEYLNDIEKLNRIHVNMEGPELQLRSIPISANWLENENQPVNGKNNVFYLKDCLYIFAAGSHPESWVHALKDVNKKPENFLFLNAFIKEGVGGDFYPKA